MYRILHLPMMILALTAASWSNCQAAGSFQTRPAFSNTISTGYSIASPSVAVVQSTVAAEFGCGRGRVRDPATHGCRGPADIR